MEARTISGYIIIGTAIRYLLDVRPNAPLDGSGNIVDNINRFRKSCDEHGLLVSRRLADSEFGPILHDLLEEQDPPDRDIANLTGPIGKQSTRLGTAANLVRKTLLAEAKGLTAWVVREKRFSVEKLQSDIASLFSPGVFDRLPEVARYDFGEAGRCIAYEVPTAAAFHLMRGTEDVLKSFYCSIVKRERKALMWGPMVAHLRNRRSAPPKVLLDNLDNLRQNFRNPTQHPEKIYDIEESQDLLSLSLDVVNRMTKLIYPELQQ